MVYLECFGSGRGLIVAGNDRKSGSKFDLGPKYLNLNQTRNSHMNENNLFFNITLKIIYNYLKNINFIFYNGQTKTYVSHETNNFSFLYETIFYIFL